MEDDTESNEKSYADADRRQKNRPLSRTHSSKPGKKTSTHRFGPITGYKSQEDDSSKLAEPNGHFRSDFELLCKRMKLGYIPLIMIRPGTEEHVKPSHASKKAAFEGGKGADPRRHRRKNEASKVRRRGSYTVQTRQKSEADVEAKDEASLTTSASRAATSGPPKGAARRGSKTLSKKKRGRQKSWVSSVDIAHVGKTLQTKGDQKDQEERSAEEDQMDDGKEDSEKKEDATATNSTSDNAEPLDTYTTFTTRSNKNYCKPTIQVTQNSWDNDSTVTEVFVRNFKVDKVMMTILTQCWARLKLLHSLSLYNTALDADSFDLLANGLEDCDKVTSLSLDNNPLEGVSIIKLLPEDSKIQHLSLRFCGLTEFEAYGLAKVLDRPGCQLVNVSLCGNRIGDRGVEEIARSLRMNRSLQALNLTSNRITDDGAAMLAMALSQFPLTHNQLRERRRLLVLISAAEDAKTKKEHVVLPPDLYIHNRKSIIKGILTSKAVPKNEARKKSSMIHTERKSRSQLVVPSVKYAKRRSKVGAELQIPDMFPEFQLLEANLFTNPLLEVCTKTDKDYWILGNRTLVSLNLSRNLIGERGMQSLLEAAEFQGKSMQGSQQKTSGLQRLVVQHNACSEIDLAYLRLNRFMHRKDPTHQVPLVDLSNFNITPCSIPTL